MESRGKPEPAWNVRRAVEDLKAALAAYGEIVDTAEQYEFDLGEYDEEDEERIALLDAAHYAAFARPRHWLMRREAHDPWTVVEASVSLAPRILVNADRVHAHRLVDVLGAADRECRSRGLPYGQSEKRWGSYLALVGNAGGPYEEKNRMRIHSVALEGRKVVRQAEKGTESREAFAAMAALLNAYERAARS
jgi:hypothetical protein